MLIKCCYRLIPEGEVIHSVYDSEKEEIIGMPLDWFNVKSMSLPVYSPRAYINAKGNYDEMCESILLSNKEFALVIENNAIGYYILDWGGLKRFLDAPTDTRDSSSGCVIPLQDNYVAIGYRVTKLRQLRACSGVYRLTMNKHTNLIHTNDGVLIPDFDVSELSPLDYHYAGYKDAVNGNHYAVVYLNSQPTFVDLTNKDRLTVAM